MLYSEQVKIISNFLADSAKIIFGSLVVGVFIPSASGEKPWLTFALGILLTITFLSISILLSKPPKQKI